MVADRRREMMDGKLNVVAAVEGNHIKISEASKTQLNNVPPVKQKLLHKCLQLDKLSLSYPHNQRPPCLGYTNSPQQQIIKEIPST